MSLDPLYAPASMTSSNALAADARSLANLKMQAGSNSAAAIQETAKQFESLFMRELLKSMREATMKSGMLDNQGSDLGTDLLDQQFAVQMSGQKGGLSELIAQQLSRQMGVADPKAAMALPTPIPTGAATTPLARTGGTPTVSLDTVSRPVAKAPRAPTESQVNFVRQHSRAANEAERASGIPAGFMLGQAGHETGWGRFEIKQKGGAPSHNLFGIKAGASWKGKVAEVTTTEYVNGVAQKQVARFRAYDSYQDAFKDYARLLTESPRYAAARQQTGSAHAFATGLQRAGYATDPEYAAKLSRAINTTLHLRRVQV